MTVALVFGCASGGEPNNSSSPLTLGSNGQDDGSGTGDDPSGTSTGSQGGSATSIGADGSTSASSTDAGSTSAASTGEGPPSVITDCEVGWSFDPELPVADQPVWIGFTDDIGHTNIGLDVQGPGLTMFTDDDLEGEPPGPWTWSWLVEGIGPGQWTTTFESEGNVVSQCHFEVF